MLSVDDDVRMALIMLYADMLDQMERAVAQHERAAPLSLEKAVVGTAMRVLQGRLEGVGLVWYTLHGNDDECEDELRLAANGVRRGR